MPKHEHISHRSLRALAPHSQAWWLANPEARQYPKRNSSHAATHNPLCRSSGQAEIGMITLATCRAALGAIERLTTDLMLNAQWITTAIQRQITREGHVIQLVESRTGTPLIQVPFPGTARVSLPESTVSADSLTVSVQPPCVLACIDICVHVNDPKHYENTARI